MKRSEIENKIRQRIFDMEEEVDVQKIMAGIPTVAQKSRKGLVYWFIGVSAGILLISGVSYFAVSGGYEVNTLNSRVNIDRPSDEYKGDTQYITDANETQNISLLAESNIETVSIQNDNDRINVKMSSSAIAPTQESATIADNQLEAKKATDEANYLRGEIITTTSDDLDFGKLANVGVHASKQQSIVIAKKSDNILLKRSHRVLDFRYQNDNTLDHFILNELDPSLFVLNNVVVPTLPKTVDCPTFGRNPWEFEFGVLAGLSNPTKALAPKNNQDIPAYPSRAINEKSLEGLDLELFLSAKRARWPVFIKSGINYSRWSERMTIDESYTEVDTVQGIISTTVSQSGDTITYIYGDIYVERDYQINKSIHYFLHRFDIPLSIVYEGFLTDNQSLQAEVGTRINFSTLARGRIYNNDLEFSNASLPNFFRKFSGLSYFTKLHYRYYLSEQQFIGASAYFQHLPADFSTSTNQIEQRYLNCGLGVYYGMRF